MQSQIEQQLTRSLIELGLHESDCIIYLLGLKIGASTVVQLADESGMNRVTVHDIVGRLVDKGLFLETRSGQRRLVYPKQVDALQSLVDTKRSELTQLQSRVDQTLGLLRDVQLSSTYLPQIRFYKGQEGIAIMGREMLEDSQPIAIISDSWHFDGYILIQIAISLTMLGSFQKICAGVFRLRVFLGLLLINSTVFANSSSLIVVKSNHLG